jgi:CRISPR-associated protein Cas2
MKTLFYIIVYDIPADKKGNKRRTRLHDLLSGYGERTQYSLFECFLTNIQFAKLKGQIETLINRNEDCLRIFVLDHHSLQKTITYGSEKPQKENTIIL